MSDREDKEIPEQTPADMFKAALYDNFLQQYRTLTQFINRLPCSPALKTIIIQYFDTGYLWTKEVFLLMDLSAQAPTPIAEMPNLPENSNVQPLIDDEPDAA